MLSELSSNLEEEYSDDDSLPSKLVRRYLNMEVKFNTTIIYGKTYKNVGFGMFLQKNHSKAVWTQI